MCTFDIVPSLGAQSQVLNIAEASVFIQSIVPSTRFAIGTHYRYRLLYSTTKVPIGTVTHLPQVLITHHKCQAGSCPTHNPQLPIRRSDKGFARPRNNPSDQLLYVVATSCKPGLSYHEFPNKYLTYSSQSIHQIKVYIGIKEYGK